MPLPGEKGSYVLILRVPFDGTVTVGRLGSRMFIKGYYAYTGSAMGPGGLAARVGHHLKRSDHPHWHLDYLRRIASVQQVWYCVDGENREHLWAGVLREMSGDRPVEGFGCSDCRCESHLYRFARRPGIARFRSMCRLNAPGHGALRRWTAHSR